MIAQGLVLQRDVPAAGCLLAHVVPRGEVKNVLEIKAGTSTEVAQEQHGWQKQLRRKDVGFDLHLRCAITGASLGPHHVLGGAAEALLARRLVPGIEKMSEFVPDGVALAFEHAPTVYEDPALELVIPGDQAAFVAGEVDPLDFSNIGAIGDVLDRNRRGEVSNLGDDGCGDLCRISASLV